MSQFPTASSVTLVTRIVAETFDVTEVEARANAGGLVALADGWGGVGPATSDWTFEVKKYFGERLKWRSEVDRQRFLDQKKVTIAAYESYIRVRK
jgi:hypothetical protein